MSSRAVLAWAFVGALAAACHAGGSTDPGTTGTGATASGGTAGAGGATTTSTTTNIGGFSTGGSGGSQADAILYVHSNTTLYRGDPSVAPLTLELLGDFDCVAVPAGPGQTTSMTDVAVNREGALWGLSSYSIYQIDPQPGAVHCSNRVSLNNPSPFYGVTFAPEGVLDPSTEVLVAGNSAGELWSIDGNGNLAQRGTFGLVPADDGHGHVYANAGQPWELSGDIVFLYNGGSPVGFATVRDCPNPPDPLNCNKTDTLIELDVPALATATTQSVTKSVRGQVVKRAGCSDAANQSYGSMYGIAAFQSSVFGFSRNTNGGFAVEVSNVDGTACLVQSYTDKWAGAGITTLAPVIAPPN
ncbi:MAG: hypothetical protein IT373_08620 [Polyangiaceae bacterium]|nr:hypothetical protein [Polyangiaceae bacterium]